LNEALSDSKKEKGRKKSIGNAITKTDILISKTHEIGRLVGQLMEHCGQGSMK
jgi:hypothetical protein